jgi:hypothetical protein
LPTKKSDHGEKIYVNGEEEKPVKKTSIPPRSGWQQIVRQMQDDEKKK